MSVALRTRPVSTVLLPIALLLTTVPIFFAIYRTAAFNTVSRDDYGPYLLFLVGEGSEVPASPFGYRILSVAAAIPFYHLMPVYTFKNLGPVDTTALRAAQALSMVSYLSIVLTSFVVYKLARDRSGASPVASLSVSLLAILLLTGFVGFTGVDELAILMIAALLYYQDNPVVFSLLILLSVITNEKISIIFATLMVTRFILWRWKPSHTWSREVGPTQLLAAVSSLAAYFLLRMYIRFPGHEEHTSLRAVLPAIVATTGHVLSAKGLVLILIPTSVLAIIVVLAYASNQGVANAASILPISDISAFVALLMLVSVIDIDYNGGRVVMHAFPVYLPSMARFLDDALGSG